MNAKMLVKLWKKLHAHIEEHKSQYFPNEEILVPASLLRCVMRNTEDVNEDATDEWLQCDACEAGFQHITDTYIITAATKRRKIEGNGN